MSNYRHPGSSAHGVGSARRVCYVASASAGSAASAEWQGTDRWISSTISSQNCPEIVKNPGLASLFRPKSWISITILTKNGPTCGISITMVSKVWDYNHYFVHMVLGGTFWIPAAPRRLSRTAAAPLYIQTPDQPHKRPHII